jgi:hypothetical protein
MQQVCVVCPSERLEEFIEDIRGPPGLPGIGLNGKPGPQGIQGIPGISQYNISQKYFIPRTIRFHIVVTL